MAQPVGRVRARVPGSGELRTAGALQEFLPRRVLEGISRSQAGVLPDSRPEHRRGPTPSEGVVEEEVAGPLLRPEDRVEPALPGLPAALYPHHGDDDNRE